VLVKPFRERNPLVIGAVGLTVVAALIIAAFQAEDLPFIGGGEHHSAAFREAAGIQEGNEVRIAGVKVGKVTGIDLEGQHVRIDFRVDHGTELGSKTGATIRLKTVLGQKYLALAPAGSGRLKGQIPLSRTASPYDVIDAVSGLSRTIDKIDTGQLATAFDTLSDTFADTPEEVQGSLRGLSRLSRTIASRDEQVRTLLERARGVTKVLAERDTEFQKLVADGNLLLVEVNARKDAIHRLLVSTAALADQLTRLVQENKAQLRPALDNLRAVVAILQRNQNQLAQSIRLLAPFVRAFANTLGNGRWFDTYVEGLVPPPIVPKGVAN
jgi:phospholipid/cholesterol/gamma-HCH transport system substrate-binding protein